MSFLYPWFLLAGLAIAIPILIHLFNFRKYKKVLFPDIRFLKELQEQTQKQSQLKHLLILLSRILAVLALVFAFAQPFFSKDKDKMVQGYKAVSIYIDNSFSMGIEKNQLSMLDLAKGKAKEIIETYSGNDRFQILSNDFGYNENRFLSKEDALRHLSTLRISSSSKKAESILEKQKLLLQTEATPNKQLIFISDFQKNNFASNLKSDDPIKKYFISVKPSQINNISLDSAWFDSPSLLLNEPNVLTIKLSNHGEEEINTSLSIMVNGQLKSAVNTTLKANEHKNETLNFSTNIAGQQNIKVFLQDSPVQFDDTFYLAGKVNANYAVLVLNQQNANPYLSSVFKPNNQFRMDNYTVQSFNTDVLKNYSLVILNNVSAMNAKTKEALINYTQNGGAVLTFAPVQNNVSSINTFMSEAAGCQFGAYDTSKIAVSSFNRSHNLFRDLFTKTPENVELPQVFKRYIITKSAMSSEQKLFSFSNGDAFLSAFNVGNGKLYVCASSAESNASNFPRSYWFLPLIYKMAYSNAASKIYAVTLGKNAVLQIDNTKTGDKTIYHLTGNGIDAIPEQRSMNNSMQLFLNRGIETAGLYAVHLEGAKDSVFTGINYNRDESGMQFWGIDELKKSTQLKNAEWLDDSLNAAGSINELQHGMPIWKICVLLALLFLLIEILLIRFMK